MAAQAHFLSTRSWKKPLKGRDSRLPEESLSRGWLRGARLQLAVVKPGERYQGDNGADQAKMAAKLINNAPTACRLGAWIEAKPF